MCVYLKGIIRDVKAKLMFFIINFWIEDKYK